MLLIVPGLTLLRTVSRICDHVCDYVVLLCSRDGSIWSFGDDVRPLVLNSDGFPGSLGANRPR